MYPNVRIKAAPAEVIVTNHLHIEGFTGIGTASIGSRGDGKCQSEGRQHTQKESNVTYKFHRTSFH